MKGGKRCGVGIGNLKGRGRRRKGDLILDLNPPAGVTQAVQRKNLDLLDRLNGEHAQRHPHHTALAARMESYELAFRMQAEVPGVIDIDRETAATKAMYGIGEKQTDSYGRRLLLARRLIENGVRFVQVYAGGWDSHDYIKRSHTARMHTVDKPIAALIRDLKSRGMLDQTLVISAGEFGRSPDNGLRGGVHTAGRDHNSAAMAVWMAGGGVKRGHVVGATDEIGAKAVEVARPIRDLRATLLHLMGRDEIGRAHV